MCGETIILSRVRLAAAKIGWTLFRNNVGALKDKDGRVVSYGLCKGSSDLIGWRPLLITQDMVGKTIAQFVAVECKAATGSVTPEQQRFTDTVNKAGGVGIIAREPLDIIA